MSAQYLTLNEPRYVPKYNTLDTNLINTVDTEIQKQGEAARKYQADTIDMTAANIGDSFQGLNDIDKQYVQQRVASSKQTIEDGFVQHGARNMIPHINREVGNLSTDLAIPKSISAKISQAQEKLSENENLPQTIRQQLLNNLRTMSVKYDENGKPIGTQGGVNEHDLTIASNWEDWTDDVQKFINGIKDDTSETGFLTQDGNYEALARFGVNEEDYAVFRRKISGVSGYKIAAGVAAFLSSNPKYREQLDLLGRTSINNIQRADKEANLDPRIKTLEDGSIRFTIDEFVLDASGNPIKEGEDEYGNPIYKTKPSIKTYNSAFQFAAADIASTYSLQGGVEVSLIDKILPADIANRRTKGNQTANYAFPGGLYTPDKEFGEYLSEISQEEVSYENQVNSFQEYITESVAMINGVSAEEAQDLFSIDDEGNVLYQIKTPEGNIKEYDIDYLIKNEMVSPQNGNSLKEFERNLGQTKQSIARVRQERQTLMDESFSLLNDYFEEDIFKFLEVNEHGQLIPKEESGLTEATKINFKSPFDLNITSNDLEKLRSLNIKEGEMRTMSLNTITRSGTVNGQPITSIAQSDFMITKKDGQIKASVIDEGLRPYYNKFNEYMQQEVDQRRGAGQYTEYLRVQFSPDNDIHNNIKKIFEEDPSLFGVQGQGSYFDREGNELDPNKFDPTARFKPGGFYNIDGDFVIEGSMVNQAGHRIKESVPVLIKGDMANNIIESQYRQTDPAKLMAITGLEMLRQKLPQTWESGKSITLTPNDLNRMGINSDKTFTIERTKKRSDGSQIGFYKVRAVDKDGEETFNNIMTQDVDIYNLLIN